MPLAPTLRAFVARVKATAHRLAAATPLHRAPPPWRLEQTHRVFGPDDVHLVIDCSVRGGRVVRPPRPATSADRGGGDGAGDATPEG